MWVDKPGIMEVVRGRRMGDQALTVEDTRQGQQQMQP